MTGGAAPETVLNIGFGDDAWQAHLGGGFHGPESLGGVAFNWLGEHPGWCVLTGLPPDRDFELRLDAAPRTPFDAELAEVALVGPGGRAVATRVMAVENDSWSLPLPPLPPGEAPATLAALNFRWRRMGPPTLEAVIEGLPLGVHTFAVRPDTQRAVFVLRRELLSGPNAVITFRPGYAVHPATLPDPGAPGAELRALSFRMHRLVVAALP